MPEGQENVETELKKSLATLISNQHFLFYYIINAQNDHDVIAKLPSIYKSSSHLADSLNIIGSTVRFASLDRARMIRIAMTEALKFGYDSELEQKAVWNLITGFDASVDSMFNIHDMSQIYSEKDPRAFIENKKAKLNELTQTLKDELTNHEPKPNYFHPIDLNINRLKKVHQMALKAI